MYEEGRKKGRKEKRREEGKKEIKEAFKEEKTECHTCKWLANKLLIATYNYGH